MCGATVAVVKSVDERVARRRFGRLAGAARRNAGNVCEKGQ